MPFIKNSSSRYKNQAAMPSPKSAAYKKLLAAQAAKKADKSSTKPPKLSKAFSSLRSRQRIVELVKRAIWARVREINDSIIALAVCGNYNAAKALFDFAGVYSLPAPEDETPAVAAAPALSVVPADEPSAIDPIDAFFRSIGVEPPRDAPADLVAESL